MIILEEGQRSVGSVGEEMAGVGPARRVTGGGAACERLVIIRQPRVCLNFGRKRRPEK